MRRIIRLGLAASWPLLACIDVDAGLRRQAAFDLDCHPEQLTITPLQREGALIKSEGVTGCGRRASYVHGLNNVWVLNSVDDGRGPVVSGREAPVPDCSRSRPALPDLGYRGSCDGGILSGLSKETIRREIRSHDAMLRDCYVRLLNTTVVEGDLKLEWVIDSAGRVQSTCVMEATSALPGSFVSCVAAQVAEFRFPRPSCGGTVTVTYPWWFRMAGDAGSLGGEDEMRGLGI